MQVVRAWLHFKTWWSNVVLNKFLNDADLIARLPASPAASGSCVGAAKSMRHLLVAVLFLIVLPVWLTADIIYLDGLVPGTRDSFIAQPLPYADDHKDILAWHESPTGNVSYNCLCSFESSSSFQGRLSGAPSAFLTLSDSQQVLDIGTIWGYCYNKTTVPVMSSVTKEDNITLDLAVRFMAQIGEALVSPPVTSALLTKPAWEMARLIEAKSEF